MANTDLVLEKQNEVAVQLNGFVNEVLCDSGRDGFQKSYLISNAIAQIKKALTPEYMKPIMELQGNRLGFKTDKDSPKEGAQPGYAVEVVKNCLIEAVLMGVQPFGNQFNIIAGNCYITKEGMGHLLKNFKGLSYEIIPDLPRLNADKSGAVIQMDVFWSVNGSEKQTRKLTIPVKMNAFMGTDAVIGKATRKARAWLYNNLTGSEIPEGDVTDIPSTVVSSKVNGEETTETVTFEELKELYDLKKDACSSEEQANAERIIKGEEKTSYAKLFKILKEK